jgi:hypothetical protein
MNFEHFFLSFVVVLCLSNGHNFTTPLKKEEISPSILHPTFLEGTQRAPRSVLQTKTLGKEGGM